MPAGRGSPQTDLAAFLRAARARVTPCESVPTNGKRRRRVTGLRREELAASAGVSVDYIARLEQGRSRSASYEVIEALARALHLDEVERSHLHDLAFPPRLTRSRRPARPHVKPSTLDLLETFNSAGQPAFVLGRRLDVLAWNELAARLIVDFTAAPARDRNAARLVFLAPQAQDLYQHWDEVADQVAAILRFEAGQHPDDSLLQDLINELRRDSPRFEQSWSKHRVQRRSTGTRTYRHPVVGEITVSYLALTVDFDPDQTLYVYRAVPGSTSAAALERLRTHRTS